MKTDFPKNYNLNQIVAITGHRPNKIGNEYDGNGPYSDYIRQELQTLFEKHATKLVISGFALGADQLAVEVAINMNLDVVAAIPCDGQEKVWPKKSQKKYQELLNHERIVFRKVVSPGPYQKWKMFLRNRYMVDHAGKVISVWDGTKGGTYDAVKYTQEIGREWININPKGWEPKHDHLTLF